VRYVVKAHQDQTIDIQIITPVGNLSKKNIYTAVELNFFFFCNRLENTCEK
jgi:hypothetical protein